MEHLNSYERVSVKLVGTHATSAIGIMSMSWSSYGRLFCVVYPETEKARPPTFVLWQQTWW